MDPDQSNRTNQASNEASGEDLKAQRYKQRLQQLQDLTIQVRPEGGSKKTNNASKFDLMGAIGLDGLNQDTMRLVGMGLGGAVAVAGGLLLCKKAGFISRIRNNYQLPPASITTHETISGVVTKVEKADVFRMKHAPFVYSLVSTTDFDDLPDDQTLQIKLAGIDGMDRDKTETLLPPGKAINVQLIGHSTCDQKIIMGLVWPRFRPFASSVNLQLISQGWAKAAKLDNRILELHFPNVLAQMKRQESISRMFRRGKWDESRPGIGWSIIKGIGSVFSLIKALVRGK
mmetsp:Transcript_41215/g.66983  ORF Transcript_41215/g.66983 Transcript_41215/m.66983 type:complete len:287 (-) Transcript_41215:155-1015(-)